MDLPADGDAPDRAGRRGCPTGVCFRSGGDSGGDGVGAGVVVTVLVDAGRFTAGQLGLRLGGWAGAAGRGGLGRRGGAALEAWRLSAVSWSKSLLGRCPWSFVCVDGFAGGAGGSS
ncbi:MAG: hypothetical protein ACP5P1_01415 [Acidimicrobiales bacterium]